MVQKLLLLLPGILFLADAHSQTIWNGPTITFTKAASANPALAANQDRITANTWITRGNLQGIYNAATESSYTKFSSPANTEWATGSLANYATLTYQPWETWAGSRPNIPGMVGVQAVVHLKSENIYIGIKFLSWGVGGGSGGSFSYEGTTAAIPAPVKLIAFSASKKNSLLDLNWKTASEENTASFSVERSADGKRFTAIGTVPSAGYSHSEKQYSFTDAAPLPVNFYRLRTNDKDGTFSYSAVVVYRLAPLSSLQVFPNPVTQALHLQRKGNERATVQIIDPAGRVIRTLVLPQGGSVHTIDVSTLKPGMYVIMVGEERQQFVKE